MSVIFILKHKLTCPTAAEMRRRASMMSSILIQSNPSDDPDHEAQILKSKT